MASSIGSKAQNHVMGKGSCHNKEKKERICKTSKKINKNKGLCLKACLTYSRTKQLID